MPVVAIELVSVEEGQFLKPLGLQMGRKNWGVVKLELVSVPSIISSLGELRIREFYLQESLYAIRGRPKHIDVAPFLEVGYRLRRPS